MSQKFFLQPLANQIVPRFIKKEYTVFYDFLKDYHDYFNDNYFSKIADLENRFDLDLVNDIDILYSVYAKNFPYFIEADKRLFIRVIHDMNKFKGTEDSYRMFFSAVYGEEIDFYYPKKDLFRCSAANYVIDKSIKVTYSDELLGLEGIRIKGRTSNATASIESIISYYQGIYHVSEIFLSDITGIFIAGETLINLTTGEDIDSSISIYNCIIEFNITNGGTDYEVGDSLVFSGGSGVDVLAKVDTITKGSLKSITINAGGTDYEVGDSLVFSSVPGAVPASAEVSSVDGLGAIIGIRFLSKGFNYKSTPTITVNSDAGTGADLVAIGSLIGGIKAIKIIDFGVNYSTVPTIDMTGSGDGNATITAVKGTLCNYPGTYKDKIGFPSNVNKLQDGYYWQDFSYVVKSGVSINTYRDYVKATVHPAGFALFGQISSVTELEELTPSNTNVLDSVVLIIDKELDVYCDWLPLDDIADEEENIYSLGNTYKTFDDSKFVLESDKSAIYHYFDVQVGNFFDENKYRGFDFQEDSEIDFISHSTTIDTEEGDEMYTEENTLFELE